MQSFDIFDTIIARRCVEAVNIFIEVAWYINDGDFTLARQQAEWLLTKNGDYNLEDIYRKFAEIRGITVEAAFDIMAVELDVEEKNVFLISDNYEKIQTGDFLITDMYLNETRIRRLLKIAGFDKEVTVVQTTNGKFSGALWAEFSNFSEHRQHTGDNQHSDVYMAVKNGVAGHLAADNRPTMYEFYLRECGLEFLARCCREARLRARADSFFQKELREIQLGINAPLLIIAAVFIIDTCKKKGLDQALFSSRDCFMWLRLVRRLGWFEQEGIRLKYFYTSRLAKLKASADYLAYLEDIDVCNSLVVDLVGTGWSAQQLQSHLKTSLNLFFVNYYGEKSGTFYRSGSNSEGLNTNTTWLFQNTSFDYGLIESLNYADHGTVLDVIKGPFDTFAPVFGDNQAPKEVSDLSFYSQSVFSCLSDTIHHYGAEKIYEELLGCKKPLIEIMRTLYANLGKRNRFYLAFSNFHHNENMLAMTDIWTATSLPEEFDEDLIENV